MKGRPILNGFRDKTVLRVLRRAGEGTMLQSTYAAHPELLIFDRTVLAALAASRGV